MPELFGAKSASYGQGPGRTAGINGIELDGPAPDPLNIFQHFLGPLQIQPPAVDFVIVFELQTTMLASRTRAT